MVPRARPHVDARAVVAVRRGPVGLVICGAVVAAGPAVVGIVLERYASAPTLRFTYRTFEHTLPRTADPRVGAAPATFAAMVGVRRRVHADEVTKHQLGRARAFASDATASAFSL